MRIRREISIRLDLTPGLPKVSIDPVQIQQVLLNLANNGMDAIDAKGGPGVLRIVTAWRGAQEICVSVEDSGLGLGDQVLARMFEPFFTTKPMGIGMGLAICRSILEAHDGQIWAETSSEGTRILVTLKAQSQAT